MNMVAKRFFYALVLFGIFFVFSFIYFKKPSEALTPLSPGVIPDSSISLGIQTSPASTLLMVAKEKGFFKQQQLQVELKEFTAGKFALQAFLGGSLDAVVSGEVPVLLAGIQGNKIHVISQVVERTENEIRMIARKDGTEGDPYKFFKTKKRSIATSFGGGPEYFTYTALKTLGLSQDDVTLVSQRPEDMPAALASGSVDVISVFDPFAFISERELADKATTLKINSPYRELYILSVSEKLLGETPEVAEKLLTALLAASKFIQTNPNQAKEVLQRFTKLDSSTIDGIWNNFVFKPVLSQELLQTWLEEIKWFKATGKFPAATDFDPTQFINSDPLLKVDSSLVNTIISK